MILCEARRSDTENIVVGRAALQNDCAASCYAVRKEECMPFPCECLVMMARRLA